MTPTINVNLKKCPHGPNTSSTHEQTCIGRPAPIPCPIPPKVEMTVRLGDACTCTDPSTPLKMRERVGRASVCPACSAPIGGPCVSAPGIIQAESHIERVRVAGHLLGCLARPIRVTCTIGGETWAGSKPLTFTMPDGSEAPMVIADACRAAWEIVVALVTGKSVTTNYGPEHPILKQRDAVFEALADLVRLDTQRDAALARAAMALGGSVFVHSCPRAEEVLGQYVSHLIAKVSEL